MKKNENGFGAVEIILTIVILGLVGGLGFYLYNKNQPKDESNKTQTQNSTAAPQGLTEASAAETVNDFYDKYVELDPTGNPETQKPRKPS